MKKYIFTVLVSFVTLSVVSLFGQDEYLKNKISKTEQKQIKDKKLVDYNLLEHTKGKITIIEFWETWCAPCIEGMYHLKTLKDKFSDEIEIVCVSCDDLEKTISFIEKNKFPFTFIYDKEKYLKAQIFPHRSIPHSILVDKTGKIQASSLPGFITEEVLKDLIKNKQIDIPNKELFNPETLSEKKSENTLINFELRSYQLGDRGYFETKIDTRSKRILTDYTGGGYKDTIENITETTTANRNILELYQYAYENIPLTRFIYDKELNYINSHLPNHRYTMIFSSSDLVGNHYSILINQLNSIFGLKTRVQEKETEVLILDAINTNTGNITKSYDNTKAGMSLKDDYQRYTLNASYINSMIVIKALEDFFKIPVETEIPATDFYNIEISIEIDRREEVDAWLELFKKNGLILRKDKKILKFIEIEKSI